MLIVEKITIKQVQGYGSISSRCTIFAKLFLFVYISRNIIVETTKCDENHCLCNRIKTNDKTKLLN